MTISQRIRQLRLGKKMTLKEIAGQLGVPTSTYRDWEYGRKVPAEVVSRLAEFYGLPISAFTANPKAQQSELRRVSALLEEALQIVRSAL